MKLAQRYRSVVDSRIRPPSLPTTEPLDDEHIAEVLRNGFAPNRCSVDFQDHGFRIALHVWSSDGREFVVEGTRIDLLRDPAALSEYLNDVRFHFRQRKLRLSHP